MNRRGSQGRGDHCRPRRSSRERAAVAGEHVRLLAAPDQAGSQTNRETTDGSSASARTARARHAAGLRPGTARPSPLLAWSIRGRPGPFACGTGSQYRSCPASAPLSRPTPRLRHPRRRGPQLRQRSYFPEWLLERRERAERALTSAVATGINARRPPSACR